MQIKEMETSDIKAMLTSMNRQIRYADSYTKSILKEYYKDHIEACENELRKRSENYESYHISG